ncbi:hypothetical protein [Lentzea sp. E54]|uniref:hypothetical protein n=1 Tax=Lentzea xerophila TaxID=3435883 RepID=UPI003DA61624
MNDKEIARFTLTVRQTPFHGLYRDKGPDKDETALPVAGVQAYLAPGTKPDSFHARIVSADSKVQATLGARTMADNKDVTDYRGTFVKLVERVAENFAKGPQGRSTHVHTGRYEGMPNACDVLSAELFQELAQDKDSGLVEADFRVPESLEKFVTDKNETRYFYSNQQNCRRLSPEWFNAKKRSEGKALKVELRTYRDADMAVKDAQDCNPNSPSRAITGEAVLTEETIGDHAACSFLVGDSPTMSFVAGRTQVRLTGYGDWAPDDPRKYNEVFTPIAKRVVDEVREAIG